MSDTITSLGSPPDVLADPDRLEALRSSGLLDSPAEEAFDRLTRLAISILRVPVSLVSIVDRDRQFFKSSGGLPAKIADARQTPLTHSFCQHVVGSGEPLIISDARQHPLVRENLAIGDLGVIAYAGFPIAMGDGSVIGSLCAIDDKPHEWTEAELMVLRELAAFANTELALRAAQRQAERAAAGRLAVIESSTDGIYTLDLLGRATLVNSAAAAILGHEVEQMLGQNMHELMHHHYPDGRPFPEAECPLFRAVHEGIPIRLDGTTMWRRDGTSFPADCSAAPIFIDGEIRGAVVSFRDVTERVAATRAREEMLAIVSHDLRNPVHTIMMATSLLMDLPLDDAELTRQKVQIIERAARRADRLIRDLMDITRIENGKMLLEPQEFGAAEALAEASLLAASEAEKKGITISVVPLEWPLTALADRHRVLQALDNLISNAIKFTPKGGQVRLSTASVPEGLMFEVSDSGPGIPLPEQANMFRPFWQARRVDRRGVGLGLSIVKGIVDAHGGRIEIESDGKSGTTIRFTVPAAHQTAAAAGTVTTERPAVPPS